MYAQKTADLSTISEKTLNSILEKNRNYYAQGKVADYIPELGKMDAKAIAFSVVDKNGKYSAPVMFKRNLPCKAFPRSLH